MKEYSSKISLIKNRRGIYCLDTTMGCKKGMSNEKGGCYNDCYASKSALRYGFNFNKTVLRFFENENHRRSIVNKINRIKLDFVRIGCSGDPSENWEHTINILKGIDKCNKQIVIITRHWTLLNQEQLFYLSTINVCINTSVSALDKSNLLKNSIEQYQRLKPYCKSILRIVSCNFNQENKIGKKYFQIQNELFDNEDTLDTVFRPSKNNKFILDNIINVSINKFMNSKIIISKMSKSVYTGMCGTCSEMCGINIQLKNKIHPDKPGIIKQLQLFKKK